MALAGTLRFRQRRRQRWTTCGAVLVRPDAWHEINARGTDVLIAFVEAESELGAALAEPTSSEVAPIPPATVAAWRTQLGDAASLTAARVRALGEADAALRPAPAVDRITGSNASCERFRAGWRKQMRCPWMPLLRAARDFHLGR